MIPLTYDIWNSQIHKENQTLLTRDCERNNKGVLYGYKVSAWNDGTVIELYSDKDAQQCEYM